MSKNISQRLTLTLRMYPTEPQKQFINDWMEKERKIYNKALNKVEEIIKLMETDEEYVSLLEQYKNEKNDKVKKEIGKLLSDIRTKRYNLTEYGLEPIFKEIKNKYYSGSVSADINAKLSTNLMRAVEKHIFNHSGMHYKKYGEVNSLEGKSNKQGIIYDKTTNAVRINTALKQNHKSKMWNKDHTEYKKANKKKYVVYEIPVKIRYNDTYAQELLKLKICYCRIIREPFKNGYKYFIQLILDSDGKKVLKLPKQQKGTVGIDLGPSSIAVVSKNGAILENLAPQADKCNKDIIRLSRKLERLRRLNNPQNYNEDGTIKTPPKGEKIYWYRSKHYIRVLFQFKNAYRRKSAITKQSHNILANKIISMGQRFFIEELDIRSWQKKSTKPTTPSTKLITVIDKKTKKEKQVYKYVRKKRFGKSIQNHSPGLLIQLIKQKLLYYGQMLEYVNTIKYRASQYEHTTGEYIKPNLKDRVKTIGTHKVQRDLYSAFLIKNNKDSETVDQLKCNKEFYNFLNLNNVVMNNLKQRHQQGEIFPSCMAVNEF